jgi:hypothetical protein
MPILRPSLAATLLALAVPALAQTNPLEGDTRAPQTALVADPSGGLMIPSDMRGKLLPDPDNAATGGVAFADEEGWYRFTMPNGGAIDMAGPMRAFVFDSDTHETKCAAQRIPDPSFAQFTMQEIQAELETIYPSFDQIVTTFGFEIEARKTMLLDYAGQRTVVPLKILGWDARDGNGVRATFAIMPAPAGVLVFVCSGELGPGHNREIIQRYLRMGAAMTKKP